MQASDGNFYGTVVNGGTQGYGGIYRMTPLGEYTLIYSFTNGLDGSFPESDIVEGPDGNLYGTAGGGGAYGGGVVFKMTFAGPPTTIYSFCSMQGCTDGGGPSTGLTLGSDGNFYGGLPGSDLDVACDVPNAFGCGTIFRLTPKGAFTLLHTFTGPDGAGPTGDLIQATDGNFYGATLAGGNLDNCGEGEGCGTLFKITPGGDFTLIHSFADSGGDGAYAYGRLTEAGDGNLYGAAAGDLHPGTVFRITPPGTFSTLYSFKNDPDGALPTSGLRAASDGNLYGTTLSGGTHNDCGGECGIAYRLTTAGTLTTLWDFCADSNCSDGHDANVTLSQGSDGALYGTTYAGGNDDDCDPFGCGTIYRLTPSPALPPPIQLSFTPQAASAGAPVTLSWSVLNAFSTTMQQCYANVQNAAAGAGLWTRKQVGTYNSSSKRYTGSATITPTTKGTYTYALTCGGQESGFATLVVGAAKAAGTTTLTASPNPASVGQQVVLTASVSGASGTPTGTISFRYGQDTLATKSLTAGAATLTVSTNGLSVNAYALTAAYSGDSTYGTSDSPSCTVPLNAAPTSTTLSADPPSVTPPGSVTLTATVKRSATGANGTPTGFVTFYYKKINLGMARLNSSGVAVLSVSSKGQSSGSYAVTGNYSGDAFDLSSISSAELVTVK